jgi:hypothetical protein
MIGGAKLSRLNGDAREALVWLFDTSSYTDERAFHQRRRIGKFFDRGFTFGTFLADALAI